MVLPAPGRCRSVCDRGKCAAGRARARAGRRPRRPATLVYGNRPITEFRAIVLTRTPEQRAAGTVARLDGVIAAKSPGAVASQTLERVNAILVDGQTPCLSVWKSRSFAYRRSMECTRTSRTSSTSSASKSCRQITRPIPRGRRSYRARNGTPRQRCRLEPSQPAAMCAGEDLTRHFPPLARRRFSLCSAIN